MADDLAPAYPRNILDEDRQGVLGRPLDRVDGPLKVCGRATYAYEYAGQGLCATPPRAIRSPATATETRAKA